MNKNKYLKKLFENNNSFFLIDEGRLLTNLNDFLNSFKKEWPGKIIIGYSFKTNYTPYLCKKLLDHGCYAEVVSEMELELAKKLLKTKNNIIFNGPIKTKKSLEYLLKIGGVINIDSLEEWDIIKKFPKISEQTRISIRCNFNDHISKFGSFSRFGIDTSSREFDFLLNEIKQHKNLSLYGLHFHLPFRSFESFNYRSNKIIDLIEKKDLKNIIKNINIGGGFYSKTVPSSTKKTDFSEYSKILYNNFSKIYKDKYPSLSLEPGTAIVADSMFYFSKVYNLKKINNLNLAHVYGSIYDYSGNSKSKTLPIEVLDKNGNKVNKISQLKTVICGYTCIEDDRLSENVNFQVCKGDFIKISNVGSYSIVMKPPFISPAPSIFLYSKNDIIQVKKQENFKYIFDNFLFNL